MKNTNRMKKEHYVILSNGEYSDYSPTYFRGEREITQNELDEQGVRIGDECMDWYENLPERTILDWRGEPERVNVTASFSVFPFDVATYK